jgi:transposase-like protein
MRGQPHSDETKAAVIADLLAGHSNIEIARRYDLPESSVRNWKKALTPEEKSVFTLPDANAKREEFGELVSTFLRKNLHALIALSERFGDPDWIREQNCADLAVLFGISTDKVIRLLEAAERAAERNDRYALPSLPDRELR